jgi:hypothetical protein
MFMPQKVNDLSDGDLDDFVSTAGTRYLPQTRLQRQGSELI